MRPRFNPRIITLFSLIMILLSLLFAVTGIAADAVLHFDGVDDFVLVGSQPEMLGASHLTIEAWVKYEVVPQG